MNMLLTITVITLIVVLLLLSSFIGFLVYNELNKKRKLEEMKLYSDMYKESNNLIELLDNFINSVIDEYTVENAEVFTDYINEKAQEKMIRDIFKKSFILMSPLLLTQLKLVYNGEYLEEIILNKIKLNVIMMTIENNNSEN